MIKGEISEDLKTYEIQHPLRLAKTASQDFGYEHQLQGSGLVPEFSFACKQIFTVIWLKKRAILL